MKYRDLIDFQPIEEIIELRDADKADRARDLVSTYVISDQMTLQMKELIAANLDFAADDAKGIFVIGNYGTGKSHLMAVVSSVAEHADLLPVLSDERARTAFKPVAGKYLVARMEIGAVKTPLRDIVIRELERHLKAWDVAFTFPPVDKITNHKDAIEAMLAAVEANHPGKGVLLVIDELLDYLRAFKQEEVIGQFNFLRELGEACGNGRFRVIAGLQESLFDSPSFSFIANVVQRVQDRYRQVLITRDDLAYVVESRLLKKTAEQRNQIREHLERFAPLFPKMQAHQADYVRLFPIHPRYLEVFEEVEIAEKREVLKTFSREIRARFDEEVPADAPGLISYDAYWDVIAKTPTFLANPTVGEVEGKASVVLRRVQSSYPNPALKPAAERVVAALAVFRLAVGDIRKPIGLTAENLRDDLTLLVPNLPERDPEFLTTTIDSVLKNIRITVNGQFISSGDNGQYYIDLDRVIDYEARIDERIERLSEELLDRYYFSILAQVMERTTPTYVAGYRIWEYEVEWPGHRVKRPGYLFFGGPNDRSTAQPPRAFYLFFLGLFDQKPFDQKRPDDEVIFGLARPDDAFRQTARRHASALEWAAASSGDEKVQYQTLGEKHFRAAAKWLGANLATAFDVIHGGSTQTFAQALAADRPAGGASAARDLVDSISSALLNASFERRWPTYPAFPRLQEPITEASRPQAASEAIRFIAGTLRTAQGSAILDGLKVLQGDAVKTDGSPYAKQLLKTLSDKADGHVVNRDEVIARTDGVDHDTQFGLEPDWVAVILVALAYRGEIEISVNGSSIDATNTAVAAQLGAGAVANFRSYQRPKGLPMAALRRLFEMLGLNDALLTADADRAASDLQSAVARDITKALEVGRSVDQARLWGSEIWSKEEAHGRATSAADYKAFLDRLTAMNSGAKLRNLKESTEELDELGAKRTSVIETLARLEMLGTLADPTEYLAQALDVLPKDDRMAERINESRELALAAAQSGAGIDAALKHLDALKAEYAKHYLALHGRARLGAKQDEKKKVLQESRAMRRLDALAKVNVLPAAQLTDLRQQLAGLRPCWAADEVTLATKPLCDYCMFRPSVDPAAADADMRLQELENATEQLGSDWSGFLQQNLSDPLAQEGLALLSEPEARVAKAAAAGSDIPGPDAIKALNTIFSGLQKVSLRADDVLDALRRGGPATRADLQQRLETLLSERLAGVDPSKARIVIE